MHRPARVQDRTGRRGAAGGRSGGVRLGAGWPAVGRRDAGLSERHHLEEGGGRVRRARRPREGADRRRTATASTTRRPCSSTRFRFPTGVKVWRKGILVTAAPDILYAEDTNGDDKADERKVLYRGFGEGNQQHRVNGLRWGLDNWLYVGNGDSGGVIKSHGRAHTNPKRKRGSSKSTSTAATCASAPTRARSTPSRARRSSAASATTGATGSAATTATRCGTTRSTTTTSAATRTSPRRRTRSRSASAPARPPSFPRAKR